VGENGLSSTTWAIEAYGLAKSFGNTRALSGIDLKVRKGDHLTIFGPNGAGKTTLIKLLSTLTKPSGGSALLDGLDIREAPGQIRSRLGVVSHSTFLYNNLTVSENLRFYGRMYGVTNLEQRIREVISQVQLESRLHDQVGTLSRGMKQRVAIARAVLHDPLIMLLDEPDTGLDPHATMMMRDVLEPFTSGERTVVMTTHNLERGIEFADQVVILHEGRVAYQASRQEIDIASFRETYDRCIGMSI
jgi:ABC-type multidrug transport system ATPase subunit